MSFEPILDNLSGRVGLYQILVLFAFALYVETVMAIQIFLPVFVEYKQKYLCFINGSYIDALSANASIQVRACSLVDPTTGSETPCQRWTFDQTVFQSSVRSQFQLVCGREWQASLGSTLVMLGRLFGSAVFGFLSDKFGRFAILLLSSLLAAMSAFSCAFVPYFWAYNIFRFLIGCSSGGVFLTICTYLSEIAPSSKRLHYLMVGFSAFGVSGVILTIIAYFERDHFKIQLISASLWLPVIAYPFIFTESPRWLYVKGYTERAFQACKKIAKMNQREFFKRNTFLAMHESGQQDHDEKKEYLSKLMQYSGLRRVSLVTWYCFAVNSFVYFILSFGSGSIGSNVFLNFGLMSLFEMPFRLIGFFVSRRFGRVPILAAMHLATAVSILIGAVMYTDTDPSVAVTVFSLLARGCITIALDLIWIYSLDIFPTVARTAGVGTASTLAGISCLLSPQMENLVNIWPPLPFLISGLLSFVAGILTWRYLPETFLMKTKDYLDETEDFIQRSLTICCSKKCLCCIGVDDMSEEISLSDEVDDTVAIQMTPLTKEDCD